MIDYKRSYRDPIEVEITHLSQGGNIANFSEDTF